MGIYDRAITNAQRQIKRKGQLVTWRQITDGAAPAEQPWKPSEKTVVDKSVYIIFLPDDNKFNEFLRLSGNTEVPKGKLLGYMGAVDFVPSIKDVVIRGTETLGISAIDPIAPNGTDILYTIRFNR